MKSGKIFLEIIVAILVAFGALPVVLLNALMMGISHNFGENVLSLVLVIIGVLLTYFEIPLWKSIVAELSSNQK